jgi:DNA-binding NarL/FixJ family response regulator
MRAGMSGFVLKQSAASELTEAVQAVLRDEQYVTPLVTRQSESQNLDDDERALTVRQREVLRLIAQGRIAKEIATALNISVRTAEFHRVSIMQRLGLRTTAELTRFALENGIAE